MQRRNLPTGTVTFFFSDIEDSTGVLQRLGPGFRSTLERHAEIVRACFEAHSGMEVSTEGDSFFAVFEDAPSAVAAAAQVQRRTDAEAWPEGGTIRLRIGLHAGSAEIGHDDYVGIDVNRAARIGGVGHGGQVVVSDAVRALAPNTDYIDLGRHRLKGLEDPVHLFQLKVPGLEQAFPPLRSSDARPNNLPSLETRIVGREANVSEVVRLVEDNRLVTIVGPGGIGKTRLAIEVAGRVLSEFHDGLYLVELATVTDPDLVIPSVAAVVGVDDVSVDALAEFLASKRILLVLDNLEQVGAAASYIKGLLEQASNVKILATSQVPLRVGGERKYRLSPLPWEGVDSPAVEVFATRAAEVDPTFDLDEHRDAVTRLAEALDGVPLALELAASRANVLTPEEILGRLSRSVDLLKASGADTPERHESISAAIEWSVELLDVRQQQVFDAFAVFRGGTTLAALEAVIGFDPLDDLGELVERSLVTTSSGKAGKRFEMLAPLRLYAGSRVDHTELAERHASYFHQLAIDAMKPLDGDQRARWKAILGDHHENIQAALEFLHEAGETERGFEILGSTWRYYQVAGRFNELQLWLDRFFGLAGASEPTIARATALMARAAIHYWRADPRAVDDYEEAVEIARDADNQQVLGYALSGLGAAISATTRDDERIKTQALPALDEARTTFERIGDAGGLAAVEAALMFSRSWADGQLIPHRAELERLAELYEAAGQRINTAHTILGIAACEVIDGHPREALKQALASLSLAEESGDVFVMTWALEWIATTKVELGDARTAALLAGAAGAGRESAGGGWTPETYGIDDAETRVRRELGDEADTFLAEGRSMSLDAAIELAKTT